MIKDIKDFLLLVFQSITFWVVASILLMLFRYYGINEEEGRVILPEFEVPLSEWIDISFFIGSILGLFYAIVEFVFEKLIANKLSLGLVLLSKSIIYLMAMVSVISLATQYAEYRMDLDLPNDQGWWQTSKIFWISVLYFLLSSLIFSFIKIANDNFGRGVFLNMLMGKYRKPQEEKRIFMFLDLKNSTSIAEKLGHFLYSQFIQDCFLDLNRVLNKYDAEVYQYVGDEAVLSWPFKKGIYKHKCIDLFFAFKKQLQKRSSYYKTKYNEFPEFKAGLHGGKLMIAEVGTVKKELAFHGDVINTTARIQSECNKHNESFLISEEFLNHLNLNSKYTRKPIGNILLKGKQSKLKLCAINSA